MKTVEDYEKLFPSVFEQRVGKIPGVKCSLQLRENARPVFVKARSIPHAIKEEVEKELAQLEKDGIITPVDKSDWGSPVVPVPKPDGSVRLCYDYKVAVNSQLTDALFPKFPRIDELINKLRHSSSTITAPIRKLLSSNSKFFWSTECEAAFIKLKNLIASDQTLVPYDPQLPVTVACDASPVGIGAVMSHIIDGVEKPIAFVSRSLSPAEVNYSQIDREALAIVFALDKFHIYLYGRKFTLLTDNKPLSRIFDQNSNLPAMTASRLLRYASYLSSFNYEVKLRKSEENSNADYLSRQPLKNSNYQSLIDQEVSDCNEITLNYISTSGITWSEIAEHTAKDPDLMELLHDLKTNDNNTEYSLDRDIVFRGSCVFIPKSLQPKILQELHLTHPGIVKMKQIARNYCYWPGLDKDIEHLVRSCEQCGKNQKSPAKAPLHQWEKPRENFSRVHIDYAGPRNGVHFLILVDAKSKWPEVRIVRQAPNTLNTIKFLEDIFSFHGYPEILVSDNATIFKNNQFNNYCKERGIVQIFSAPGHPSTNGLAERYVQILKSKLDKMSSDSMPIHEQVQQILHLFRATPLSCGESPAELYLHRKMRIRLDALKPVEMPRHVPVDGNIRSFSVNDRVLARVYKNNKSTWELGIVVDKLGQLHYNVRLDNGFVLKRHIDQLRRSSSPAWSPPDSSVPKKNRKEVRFADRSFDIVYEQTQTPCHSPPRPISPVQHQVRSPISPPQFQSCSPTPPQSPTHYQTPPQSPIQPVVHQRPQRNRRPPAWFGDYVLY
ncbi:hypothetical protein WDU94_000597 [Cyamophila willieti]